MKTTRLKQGLAAAVLAAILAACAAQTGSDGSVGANELGGVVTSANGPEAGVWVIAETTEMPTKFAKIVVTDDRGRYLMPDLPKAITAYGCAATDWWILPRSVRTPGRTLNLTAVPAPSPAAAAQYYPAVYWYSMLTIPAKNEFPVGKVTHQGEWLHVVKTGGCIGCHAMGTMGTRTIPKAFAGMKSPDAWARRIQSGQALPQMARDINRLDPQRASRPVR